MTPHRQHPLISTLEEEYATGRIDRREFLRSGTSLGLSASAAYGFVAHVDGAPFISTARAQGLPRGSHLRLGMHVQAMNTPHTTDTNTPHTTDTNEESNIIRQVCEYLTIAGHERWHHATLSRGELGRER